MIAVLSTLLLATASLVSALPLVEKRVVTALSQAAFEEAQQRDDTATRAFSSTEIKTSNGQCLFVDELSGDFRANLTPIQVAACDGSAGQLWDIITAGKHDNQAGTMLIVSTLTQACFNFDPRRAAGNQVLLFSCGGRGDGTGSVTNSQLFPFTGGAGPLALTPENALGTCLTVKGDIIDQAACNTADANQSFAFGNGAVTANSITTTSAVAAPAASTTTAASECPTDLPEDTEETSTTLEPSSISSAIETSAAVSVSSTSSIVTTIAAPVAESKILATTATPPATITPASTTIAATSTSVVAVSRAGSVLNPSAAAEANVRDDTATRAFSSISLKSASGQCLFIDPTAGDFRENLIPIALKDCDGSANEKWDVITAGKHNNEANSALMVSTLTQGCMNFDPRRAAGDTVIMFSCGGRADGEGLVTDSQLFAFTAGETSLQLKPNNGGGSVCLVPNGARLDQATCTGDASQLFTIA